MPYTSSVCHTAGKVSHTIAAKVKTIDFLCATTGEGLHTIDLGRQNTGLGWLTIAIL